MIDGISDLVQAKTIPNPIATQKRLAIMEMLKAFCDQVLPVREGKKASGSNNCRAISPVFGEASLIVSAKDEFLDDRNDRIAQDSGEQPELPSSPGHIEERLPPGLHRAQRMKGVNQGVNQDPGHCVRAAVASAARISAFYERPARVRP